MSERPLTEEEIASQLKALGLPSGAIVMVHSSLSSLGQVEEGADAVIDALLEAIGPEGTLLIPTFTARDERVFDPESTPSAMGLISETFRRRPGVLRSRHPYHPVAACGPQAAELLRDHEKSAVPDGPETPFGRLIERGGWVLDIGCDLDTLTLLHTVEAELGLPYLRQLEMRYLDEKGEEQSLQIERCPGGHRGNVFRFDRLFRREGAMVVGKIGWAVVRLLSAPRAAEIIRRELSRDPTFVLCENPHCADCLRFRGKVKASRLADMGLRLTSPLWSLADDVDQGLSLLEGEGIAHVELAADRLGPGLEGVKGLRERLSKRGFAISALATGMSGPDDSERARIVELTEIAGFLKVPYLRLTLSPRSPGRGERRELIAALQELAAQGKEQGVVLLLTNGPGTYADTVQAQTELLQAVGSPCLRAAYDPAGIAKVGGSPFYGGLYKGPLRRMVCHVDIKDALAKDGTPALPGWGNGEVKEIISSLLSRSFDGFFCLWPLPGQGAEGFRAAARAFWEILDNI